LGDTLSVQTSRTGFELVEGTDLGEPGRALQASLGVPLAADGTTWITPEVPDGAKPLIRDDLLNFEGGVLMVVRGIDPPMNEAELSQRIANMRLVEEYRPVQYVRTKVLGLTPSGNGFSAFAVLSHPGEDAGGAMAGTFAQMERDLLGDALRREQAIPAINFDPAIAGNTAQLAGVAIILSWLALVAYLWLRFGSFWWGVAAVICLIHDVLIVVGLIAASAWVSGTFFGNILGIESFKIDLAMVAALLTVIGYSVNDTIVVFDRIRENRGRLTEINMRVLNASVNQTLSRTVMTSLTTLVVVLVMYIWGGAGIHGFSFALLMGVLFGTYSSVAIASPLLLGFRKALLAEAKTAEPATS
jgi:SecD/SecF fusion protein